MKKIILYLLLYSSVFASSNLEWQEDKAGSTYAFYEAIKYCKDLTLYSKNDWRLPSLLELTTLSRSTGFTHSDKPYYFWSATIYENLKITAWFVSFNEDYQHFSIRTEKMNVKCVRDK